MPLPLLGIGTGAAGAGAAGAGAMAAGGGLPLSLILPIAISLITSLFGGNDEEAEMFDRGTQMQNMLRQMGMKKPYQSPYAGGADKTALMAIINNLKRTANWGWPEGQGMDLGFLEDMLGGISSGGISSGGLRRRIE